ncbi:MAG: tetraacyldisaccharide 4'-kinase, partial [Desulfobacterales bacterium]|nr:tetraacyldisaccharide 4'-kinase [Desulfobacterales bacterium]
MYSEEKTSSSFSEMILSVFSAIYGTLIRIRDIFYLRGIFSRKRLPCKVVSIGNITVGGTGKTPMTIYLAETLTGLGYKVVVVSRGYRGRAKKKGGIVSNGREILMGPDSSGDEPFMMAARLNNIPVVVGQNRYNAGLLAIRNFNPDIILLDDGFQHRKLFRDIDLLLLDSGCPFGNGRLVPRGVLREPVVSIKRADAFILTRSSSDNTEARNTISAVSNNQPVFEAYNTFYFFKVERGGVSNPAADFRNKLSEDFSPFAGKKIVAFSGIAGNSHFRKTLEEFKCDVLEFSGFP